MRFIVTVLYLMFVVGMFTNHVGAGLLAFVAASSLVWMGTEMNEEMYREDDDAINDDDIDPRIKS